MAAEHPERGDDLAQRQTVFDLLTRCPVFTHASPSALSHLAESCLRRRLRPGEVLIHQGEPGRSAFLVVSGRVSVERKHPDLVLPLPLAELGPGEIVGEMSVLNDAPRSASVVAVEPTLVVELGGEALGDVIRDCPQVAQALLHTFSQRLRRADELAERVLHHPGN